MLHLFSTLKSKSMPYSFKFVCNYLDLGMVLLAGYREFVGRNSNNSHFCYIMCNIQDIQKNTQQFEMCATME